MKVGDLVKLTRHPAHVGYVEDVYPNEICKVVDVWGDCLTPELPAYFDFDPSRCEHWEPATDQDLFDSRFLNGTDYGEWWHCRYCCSIARTPRVLDGQHEENCPVRHALELRHQIDCNEAKLISEIAAFLTDEGYPWTANMLRDGSWRTRMR